MHATLRLNFMRRRHELVEVSEGRLIRGRVKKKLYLNSFIFYVIHNLLRFSLCQFTCHRLFPKHGQIWVTPRVWVRVRFWVHLTNFLVSCCATMCSELWCFSANSKSFRFEFCSLIWNCRHASLLLTWSDFMMV